MSVGDKKVVTHQPMFRDTYILIKRMVDRDPKKRPTASELKSTCFQKEPYYSANYLAACE